MDGDLSDLQLAFMRVLWAHEEATVAEVREGLEDLGRALKPTTVATVLKRLEARGLVSHRKEGRQFVYRAERSEQEVRRTVVRRVRDLVFGGNLEAMVAQLLDPKTVGRDELETVRRMLADAAQAQKEDETP